MTTEEIQRLAEELRSSVVQTINELLTLTHKYDPLELLARLASYQLFGSEGQKASDPEYRDRSESQVEYAQSLILSRPFPAISTKPEPDTIQSFIDSMNEVSMQVTMFHLASIGSGESDDEAELRARTMLEALHLRGEAYGVHVKETFHQLAGLHDDFLQVHLKYTSSDFMHAIEYASEMINGALNAQRDEARRLWNIMMDELNRWLGKRALQNGSMEDILKSSELNDFYEVHPKFFDEWRRAFDLIGNASVFLVKPDSEKTAAVYECLSMRFGENSDFLKKIPKWQGWPLNPSKIYSRPIVKHENHFYIFHLPLLFRNSLSILEEIIQGTDAHYWKHKFLPKRDRYVEDKAIKLLEAILPGCKTYQNVFYEYSDEIGVKRGETDGLLLFDDAIIVLEVKAGKMSDQSRRGALKSLRTDISAIVDKAYQQAARVLKVIRDTAETPFYNESGQEVIRLRSSKIRHAFLVTVSFETPSGLSTELPLIRKLGMIEGREWPWSVSLHDLQIIAEVSEHPTVFLHFLTRRIACNAHEKLVASDEIDLFGHYLRRGLYFEEDEEFQQAGRVLLNNFGEKIDDYYQYRMGLSSEVPKPKVAMPKRYEELITLLEDSRPANFVSACLALQNFDDPTRQLMSDTIQQIDDGMADNKARLGTFLEKERRGTVMLGSGKVNTPAENGLLDRCRLVLKERNAGDAIVILWHPPLSKKRLRVFVLAQ